jgi:disulfide bond formation protein DsbB
MFDWLIAAVLLAILVYLIAPQQLPVSLYKLSLVALAAVAGYWIDRSLFPYARPDAFMQVESFQEVGQLDDNTATLEVRTDANLMRLMGAAMLRRSIIVAAAMIAVSLGA